MHRAPFQHLPLLLALLPALAPAAAQEPAATAPDLREETISDSWMVMKINGAESGYTHTVVRRLGEGAGALYETATDVRMKMNRLGAVVDIVTQQRWVEDAHGGLLRVESATLMSAQETTTIVTFEDGRARVGTTIMGDTTDREVEVPPDTLGPYWLSERILARFDEEGAQFELSSWSSDMLQAIPVEVRIAGREELFLGGEKRSLVRFVATMEMMGKLESTTWSDDEGLPHRTETELLGLNFESVASDEATARRAYETGSLLSPDVFSATVIVADEFLPVPRSIESARLLIVPRREGVELPDLDDPRQRVLERREDGSVLVETRSLVPPAEHGGARPLETVPEDLEVALAASAMIQCDHADIVSVAGEAVQGETDPWRAAQASEVWVRDNVTEKGMDVGFASALEVCTNRAGDCTEHAVFLCAISRAAGIPSRVAMGLIYMGGIWGGHAWTEVWVDGEWYALDGTIGNGSVDALHLTLATMNLDGGASPAQDFAGLFSTIGEVDIEVLEVTRAGRKIDLRTGDAVRIEDDRYVNELWGIALSKRADFEFERLIPDAEIDFKILEITGRTPDRKRCKIEVHAFDAVHAKDVMEVLGSEDSRETIEVDGRTAHQADGEGAGRRPRHLVIEAGEALFLIVLNRINAEDQEALFEELVASIDLDAGQP